MTTRCLTCPGCLSESSAARERRAAGWPTGWPAGSHRSRAALHGQATVAQLAALPGALSGGDNAQAASADSRVTGAFHHVSAVLLTDPTITDIDSNPPHRDWAHLDQV